MAKTVNTIYNELIAAKESVPDLAGLTSTSSTAIWRLIYYSIAIILNVQQQLYDLFVEDIEIKKKQYKPMTVEYWIDKLKNFYQYNEDPAIGQLKVNEDYTVLYEVEDEASKIIDFASVVQVNKNVYIKVAKTVSDLPAPLNEDELNNVKGFVDRMKFAGGYFIVSSWEADSVRFDLNVYYRKTYLQSVVESQVETAIENYMKSLDFDGVIVILDLMIAIKNVPGVKNVVVNSAQVLQAQETVLIDIMANVDDRFTTKAGYAVYDSANTILNLIGE